MGKMVFKNRYIIYLYPAFTCRHFIRIFLITVFVFLFNIKTTGAQPPVHSQDSYLNRQNYGYLLKQNNNINIWWCDATQKIGKHRSIPHEKSETISCSAAKNEFEPVQLVVYPETDLAGLKIRAGRLKHTSGYKLPMDAVKIYRVEYVNIEKPTDEIGSVDAWPDPLPPVLQPVSIPKNENQPFWILIQIPEKAKPGNYNSTIYLETETWQDSVNLDLHVWDFQLPRKTHLQTAFGFNPWLVRDYHNFPDNRDFEKVMDKYYQNFARHRISPYDPFTFGYFKEQFDTTALKVHIDFGKFDALANHFFDELGYNSFRMRLKGLGSGTFHSRRKGKIAGFEQGTPQYQKLMFDYLALVEQHLDKRGWLDEAYIYWFDEPTEKDYDFVKETMNMIHQAAPRLTRMLTEQPEPELYGSVDLWCPITAHYDHEIAEQRRAKGERFWWYICTGPKAPYCTLFIDHYAVELRTWLWQTWKYGIEGILIWQTNYWTSPTAFPKPQKQNPYQDPMSYRTGYGMKSGEIGYWGNGDGRFIYPPESVFSSSERCFQGPVNSIRFEMLREGIEDWEYFWILRDLIQKIEKEKPSFPYLKQAKELLNVPESVTTSLTEFSLSPEPIYTHRQKIAEMIEFLNRGL